MKKILCLSILLGFIFVSHTFAASLSLKPDGTTINATLSNVTNTDIYQLLVQTTEFTSDTYTGTPSNTAVPFDATKKQSLTATLKNPDTLTWSLSGYAENTTYYARVLDIPNSVIRTPTYATGEIPIKTQTVLIPFLPLTSAQDPENKNNIIISGKIDTAQLKNFSAADFTASLVYTATIPQTGDTALKDTFGPLTSKKTPDASICDNSKGPCINDDGTYYWYLANLSPSTIYYYQQTVKFDNKISKVDVVNHFNSSVGSTVAVGSAAEKSLNAQHGYTLLSKGFPGLTFLPDPDLCAQERAAGKAPQFCDLNDVLNYFLKLLIGITGVVLVFRLMLIGLEYMMTDTPFVKANAKEKFFTSLMGLLLALTSYIILNTINPKLVNEDINIQQLAIGVAGTDGIGITGTTGVASSGSDTTWLKTNARKFTLTLPNNTTVLVTPCDPAQMQIITAFGNHTFQVQKNLVASVMRIDAKWKQMSPQYPIKTVGGYNCRTIANSNKISYHAYGLAVDVNEDTNGVNTAGNMPPAFIKLWADEGWGWGGNWNSYKDPMHFSKGNNEGGNLKGE